MLNTFRNLKVGVLCSHRAPGLDALLQHPQRRRLFDVSCVITTEPELAAAKSIKRYGIPVLRHPIREFFDAHQKPLRSIETRREYDRLTADTLAYFGVDTVVLLGYVYVLSSAMLDVFPDRIINVHDSDLMLTGSDGSRRYVGLHSTRDAIAAGERETRSTVHLVTPELDGGPIVLRSAAYPVAPFAREAAVRGHVDILKAYAYAHREWMMRDSWGDLVARSLEYVAAGADEEDLTEMLTAVTA